MMGLTKKHLAFLGGLLALLWGTGTVCAQNDIERSMIWSAYDVGSSGYSEASIIANALMEQKGVRIRIMPSGTSIGRLLPLKNARVKFAFLATETYFATEALYDFANLDWGPQDLRVLLGRPSSGGIATASNANIKTLEDLRGKRVAFVEANPSVNLKTEALLAFVGLTWADVQMVRMPSYGNSLRGLVDNVVDAAYTIPNAPVMYELAASPRGLTWPRIDLEDEASWARLNNVAPIFAPLNETIGAGMSEAAPATMLSYRYPMVVVYAKLSDQEAYNMTKTLVEAYDLYKDTGPGMTQWNVLHSGRPPVEAPFHPGAIRYLKEIGIWTEADDQWNAQRLIRMEQVQKAWLEARGLAQEQAIDDKDWPTFWDDYRANNLNG